MKNTPSSTAASPRMTSDKPDFHLNATDDAHLSGRPRHLSRTSPFTSGKVPVFWWPYLYQSLDRSFSYLISPAYLSSWGPSLLGQITFPIGEKITATLRLDYRSRRGPAIGFDAEIHYGKDDESVAKINTYFLQDQNPDLNRTSPAPRRALRPAVIASRSRIARRSQMTSTPSSTSRS